MQRRSKDWFAQPAKCWISLWVIFLQIWKYFYQYWRSREGNFVFFQTPSIIVQWGNILHYHHWEDSNLYDFIFKVPLARFLMMYTENDTTTFHLLAPQKGIYLLDIFAANYPSMDMCTKKEATKYINVCRFKIDCPNIDMVSIIY